MIFEFGNKITVKLSNETVIWQYINDILDALRYLQRKGFHYPLLRKRYTVYVNDEASFKLLNPYSFNDYLIDSVQVYFNVNN